VSATALAWEQFRFERRLFWRNPSAAFFNFFLPLILLLLIASVFAHKANELDVLIPGIAGMSVMANTFNAFSFNLTFLREEGILKRVRGTPIPTGSYLAGVIGSSVLNAFVTVALVVVIGHVIYGVEWPREPFTLVVFTGLGVLSFAALGIAFSQVIPNVDSAPAYSNAVFLPVIFISGVFYDTGNLPAVLNAIAEALPLKHVIDGLSAGIVGSSSADLGVAAIVVAAWAIAGIGLSARYFRWQ
jgi:ABC-2 type transport system permease protein